jgi:hypothetical protein
MLPAAFQVYQGLRNGITPVAVKLLRRDGHLSVRRMRSEVEVMKACRDPNIVQVRPAPAKAAHAGTPALICCAVP